MQRPSKEADETVEDGLRFHKPSEPLPPAAEEALNRRTPEEHQAAIDRALRRR